MNSRILNALSSIFLDFNFHRIWKILLKSPLAHPLAVAHGLRSPWIKKSRVALAHRLNLDETQRRIVAELNQNGFARVESLFEPADFFPLEKYLIEKLNQVEESRSKQLSTHKDFWVRLSDTDFAQGMTTDHPLAQLSLKENLLKVVASYLQQAPFIEYILLTYSLPSPQPLKSSQLWHRDHDNYKMIKFFVYLTDVHDTEDGPFTLLHKIASTKIKNSFFPRHLHDAEVEKDYPLSNAVQIKGKRFSTILVDTSVCYHMGSRVAENHSRLMSTSLFVTLPKSYWGKVRDFIRATKPLGELQKAAIESSLDRPGH